MGGCLGITPAGAGKTSSCPAYICLSRDHPRRCGENTGGNSTGHALEGSPPQVRGKRGLTIGGKDYIGITPAGAGKTKTDVNADMNYRDHPRRCGENHCSRTVNAT